MFFFHFVKETNFEKKNLTGNETHFEKETHSEKETYFEHESF